MGRNKIVLMPSLRRLLKEIGDNIRLARLRRCISTMIVSERAGLSRNTLRAIERGDPNVSLGAYASVLFCLSLHKDLKGIAADDVLGRKLQDAGLQMKARAPKISRKNI